MRQYFGELFLERRFVQQQDKNIPRGKSFQTVTKIYGNETNKLRA